MAIFAHNYFTGYSAASEGMMGSSDIDLLILFTSKFVSERTSVN